MSRRHIRRAIAALSSTAAILMGATAVDTVPALAAEAPALVGPGGPLRMYPAEPDPEVPMVVQQGGCTQALAGYVTEADGTQTPIMLTAGHCLIGMDLGELFSEEVAPEVYVPTTDGDQKVGERVAGRFFGSGEVDLMAMTSLLDAAIYPDWGVATLTDGVPMTAVANSVDFDGNPSNTPVRITGIRDYADLPAYTSSMDNFGQRVCKHGQNTGHSCGTQLLRTRDALFIIGTNYDHGDSGGVNFDPTTGEAVGITSMGFPLSFLTLDKAQTIDAALQDAYGIPDGQVNSRFRLPDSDASFSDKLRSFGDDKKEADAWEQTLPAPTAPDAAMDKLIAAVDRVDEMIPPEVRLSSMLIGAVPRVIEKSEQSSTLTDPSQVAAQIPSAEDIAAVSSELPTADEVAEKVGHTAGMWQEEVAKLSTEPENSLVPLAGVALASSVVPGAAMSAAGMSSQIIGDEGFTEEPAAAPEPATDAPAPAVSSALGQDDASALAELVALSS